MVWTRVAVGGLSVAVNVETALAEPPAIRAVVDQAPESDRLVGVLDSEAIVTMRGSSGLRVLDAAAGETVYEAGRFVTAFGDRVWSTDFDRPGALMSWTFGGEEQVALNLQREDAWWSVGAFALPYTIATLPECDASGIECNHHLHVAPDGAVHELFEDLDLAESDRAARRLVVRTDGAWAFIRVAGRAQVVRWDFEARRSRVVWRGTLASRFEEVWVMGHDPVTFWAVDADTRSIALLADAGARPEIQLGEGAHPLSELSGLPPPAGRGSWSGLVAFTPNDDPRYVQLSEDGVHEVVRADGVASIPTAAGAFLVVDRPSRDGSSGSVGLFLLAEGRLQALTDPEIASVQPRSVLPWADGSGVHFLATTADTGLELWTSDGTPEGTRLTCELRPGPDGAGVDPRESRVGLAVGPRAVYVQGRVRGVGEQVVRFPAAIARGDAPCRFQVTTGDLATAEAGCACIGGAGSLGSGAVVPFAVVFARSLRRRSRQRS